MRRLLASREFRIVFWSMGLFVAVFSFVVAASA